MAERIDRKKRERETKKKEHSEYNNRRTLINKINRSFQSVFFLGGGGEVRFGLAAWEVSGRDRSDCVVMSSLFKLQVSERK